MRRFILGAEEDRDVVAVADAEPPETPRKARATTGDLLDAIRAIPGQVAAQVGHDGGTAPKGGGTPEVTFGPEPTPDPEPDEAPDPQQPGPTPSPAPAQRAAFGFPGRHKRHRVEIGS